MRKERMGKKGRLAKEGFPQKVTLRLILDRSSGKVRRGHSGSRNYRCKGPGVQGDLAYWWNSRRSGAGRWAVGRPHGAFQLCKEFVGSP